MPGEGMSKDQWERKMFEFFFQLLQGSGLRFDKTSVGLILKYGQEPHEEAMWETIAVKQEFDNRKHAFINVGDPPTDPAERRRWDAERRKKVAEWEQRIRSRTGIKCPHCFSWNTTRMTPEEIVKSATEKGTPTAIPPGDYMVCLDCSTRVIWEKAKLEAVHDTEVIFKAKLHSEPFSLKGKMLQSSCEQVFVISVNGTHETWKQAEVRDFLVRMFSAEILPTWREEAIAAFDAERKRLAFEQ